MKTSEIVDVLRMTPDVFGSILRLRRTSTPPIRTPNGIAELKQVELNGYPQWLLIRGHDASKPLFLFLHGGPGESSLWLAHHSMRELERHFVCVNWDQRGTGKSLLPGPDPATMNIQQLYEDALALVELLLARFGQHKLLVLGHSWGGLLATRLAERHPELLHGVILMNSTIDNRRGEELSYEWVLEQALAAHDNKSTRTLEKLGGSDTYTKDGKFLERRVLLRHGGLVHSDPIAMMRLMFDAPEYSIVDCIRAFRMKALSFSIPLMADELLSFDLSKEVSELQVPVFFFLGRHDHTAPTQLSEDFYASLQAPHKELVWFEESAHTPDLDEPQKFQREVTAIGERFCSVKPQEHGERQTADSAIAPYANTREVHDEKDHRTDRDSQTDRGSLRLRRRRDERASLQRRHGPLRKGDSGTDRCGDQIRSRDEEHGLSIHDGRGDRI